MKGLRSVIRSLGRGRSGCLSEPLNVSRSVPVVSVKVCAEVKELLTRILRAMGQGQELTFDFGDVRLETAYCSGSRGDRSERGWVVNIYRVEAHRPYQVDVGSPPSQRDIGWIDQSDGTFIIVGTRVSVVSRLLKALEIKCEEGAVLKNV